MMNIVFLGCPGSGKGTQARLIAQKLNMVHFSTGDILWEEIQKKTPLGHEVLDNVSTGRPVPDWLILGLLKDKLGQEKRGILFDGFPRTNEQAEALDAWLTSRSTALNAVIFFNITEAAAAKRLEMRGICSTCGTIQGTTGTACGACGGPIVRRDDDKPEAVRKRMMAYKDQTEPLLSYYRGNGILLEIKADQPPQAVTTQIAMALKSVV
jgi:adenylate kinase